MMEEGLLGVQYRMKQQGLLAVHSDQGGTARVPERWRRGFWWYMVMEEGLLAVKSNAGRGTIRGTE